MIWTVIGKMFINQSFTKSKAVINGETVQILDGYLSRDLLYQKIHSLRDSAFGADCLTPLRILEIITVALKN